MERNPQVDALQAALQNITVRDAHDIYDQLRQFVVSGAAVVNEGVAIPSSAGRLLHPTLPAIYDLAWQFIRQYNALGLPTPSELMGATQKTANILNFRR
ncbi:MAG: hypothetical protein A4E60_00212 [Syntrophorhabdus sp. PtaB.Bin047]|jgi:hypothetical protein|nr:MAG: hypothetical protein A4E60_00212 [Syntrophorhabdus sp. PtaB.Bin047]